MINQIFFLFNVISSFLLIFSLNFFSKISTAFFGFFIAILGIILIIFSAFLPLFPFCFENFIFIFLAIFSGSVLGFMIAKKIKLTGLPELVAAFHSLVGLAAVLISFSSFLKYFIILKLHEEKFLIVDSLIQKNDWLNLLELSIGGIIGAITFSSSIVAFLKLSGKKCELKFIKNYKIFNLSFSLIILFLFFSFIFSKSLFVFILLITFSVIIGVSLITSIRGADMPVVVSMLNSYSGWATSGIGFSTNNPFLIIVGSLVGSSGAILSHFMCRGMNRSLISVIFGGNLKNKLDQNFSKNNNEVEDNKNIKIASPEDAAFIIKNANSVVVVPGYGMAVSSAQYVVKEILDSCLNLKIKVKFAIHPVAGRMPGHMNVLLSEAKIPYDLVFELDEINSEFLNTDVVLVIGANDITNPAAENDKNSTIYGMPILKVYNARTVFFIKRSIGGGYAGVENELFYKENTMMLLGDAKKVCEEIKKYI